MTWESGGGVVLTSAWHVIHSQRPRDSWVSKSVPFAFCFVVLCFCVWKMAHSGCVEFKNPRWNCRPRYTMVWHHAPVLAFGPEGNMPGDARHYDGKLAEKLTDDQEAAFRDAMNILYKGRYRKAVVTEFLNLYRGQPVGTVNGYRLSTGYCMMYFLEKR